MSNNVINPYQTFRDSNGAVRASGTVTFYVNGTTTLATIYSDEALTVTQTNPYTLDAFGRIVGDVKYQGLMTIKEANSDGSDPITTDNVATLETANQLRTDLADTATTTKGDALIGVKRTATGAVATTLHNWMEWQVYNVKEFGAVGDGATDDTAAFQAAHDAIGANGGIIYAPAGIYLFNKTVVADHFEISKSNVALVGDGWSTVFKKTTTGVVTGNQAMIMLVPSSGAFGNVILRDFRILGPTTNNGTAISGDNRVLGIVIHDGSTVGEITDVIHENILIEGMETAAFALNGGGSSTGAIRIKYISCHARNCRQDGFNDFGGGANQDVVYESCYAVDCDGFGFEVGSAKGTVVNGCTIEGVGQAGIGCEFNPTNSPNSSQVYTNNVIRDIGTAGYPNASGIAIGQAQDPVNVLVAGNVIQRTGGNGIEIAGTPSDITIVGNRINDVGGGGSSTVGINSTGTCTKFHIASNTIITDDGSYSMTNGIALAGSGAASNFIANNHIVGNSAAPVNVNSPTRVFHTYPPVVDDTQTGNVGTGEDDLISYTIPAYTLYADDMGVHVVVAGQTAANGNNKTVKLYFGGSVILNTGALAANNKDWYMEAYIYRINATTGRAIAWGQANGALIQSDTITGIGGLDFTSTTIVKCTGEATANGDILQNHLSIEYIGQPSNV